MTQSGAHEWQLVLADLALILFLVTLSSLALQSQDETEIAEAIAEAGVATGTDELSIAPSQELFRPTALGPTLPEWLSERPRDPRASLTIFAQYSGDDRSALWQRAQALAGQAASSGYGVRVVITQGEESDLHASIAYDTKASN